MNPDAATSEAIRDASHHFRRSMDDGEFCRECGRPRWAHVYDGHNPRPEHKYTFSDTKYRPGPHPYWTRPGQFNKKSNTKTPYFPAQHQSDVVPGRLQPHMP